MLAEIADEEDFAGIPATALLEAHAGFVGDKLARARLRVLAQLPAAAVLDLDGDWADSIADTVQLTEGDLSRAHAVWTALKHCVAYVTTETSSPSA
ncbi:hypothetical protein [Actinoplanes sp. NPDC049118]|uniref:hypothetical protein n=1 Tax=Actinoplanes sp. NPDC049118 TaxID=3155769 RepID=UPI0033C70383